MKKDKITIYFDSRAAMMAGSKKLTNGGIHAIPDGNCIAVIINDSEGLGLLRKTFTKSEVKRMMKENEHIQQVDVSWKRMRLDRITRYAIARLRKAGLEAKAERLEYDSCSRSMVISIEGIDDPIIEIYKRDWRMRYEKASFLSRRNVVKQAWAILEGYLNEKGIFEEGV